MILRGEKSISLKDTIRNFWIIMYVLIVAVYIIAQSYIVKRVEKNVELSIHNNIYTCENFIEENLEMIDQYIYENFYNDSVNGIAKLCYTMQNGKDRVDRIEAQVTLSKIVKSIDSWADAVDFAMLFADDGENGSWFSSGSIENYNVRNYIQKLVSEDNKNTFLKYIKRYNIIECNEKKYIVRIMKLDNCYFIMGVSEKTFMSILYKARYGENGIVFATDENGEIIFSSEPLKMKISFENEGRDVEYKGIKYLQSGYISDQTGYYFGVLTNRRDILKETNSMKVIFFVILVILMGFMWLSFIFLEKNVERPLSEIVGVMKEIQEGDLDITVSQDVPIIEFHHLMDSFNHMIERINKLKIEKYETEMVAQKATMQYLQMQIKPHFYANLLNIIYSLAETRDFETIQRISKSIVKFSRYMFRDATELVELRREIDYVKCYMEIQEVRYARQIALNISAEQELNEALVPPFIIQGFVENSVKYAFSTHKNCKISVKILLDENQEELLIIIHDNGKGYPKEMLKEGWRDYEPNEHIGFHNIDTRLRLIYGKAAKIEISNDNGAVTRIAIPFISAGLFDI